MEKRDKAAMIMELLKDGDRNTIVNAIADLRNSPSPANQRWADILESYLN